MSLTAAQIRDIIVTERVSSVFSLTASAFVVVTFLLNDKFRKPINRLVFYATFGNVIANIATLISTDGIEAGKSSPLCQFQAFLIQWFMPADALWMLAMGCNVWLSFFRSYDAAALRRLEFKYLLACYGLPLIPAITYLFVNTASRGRIYGTAVLWCWVSIKWDFLRVATFYGPVWIVILCTIAIYIQVGSVIFKWRKKLLSMDKTGETNEFPATGIMKTSEVIITSNEEIGSSRPNSTIISKKASFLNSSATGRHPTQSRVHRPSGGIDPNKAAMKYCKCSLLFFIALLITWVPSTVNRIYTIIRPTELVFGLNLAAAFVLPLQGFWNAIIYMATSSFAVKCLWEDIKDACRPTPRTTSSMQIGGHPMSIHVTELDDRASKISSNTIKYDPKRSSSQSELVGQAK